MTDTASRERLALSPAEAAEALGLSKEKLYQELRSGRLPSALVGRRRLIAVAAIEAWLTALVDLPGAPS